MKELKKNRLKRMNTLDIFAKDANKKITINKYLYKKYELYNHYYLLTKKILCKCLDEKNTPPITFFIQYYDEIKKDCNILENDYKNVYTKFNSLIGECGNELSMGKPILEQKKNEQFTLNFIKIERNNTIDSLKKSIKSSKDYHLFREPKRDTLIDIRKGNKEIEKITTELQKNMLYECKKCNKLTNDIKKYTSKKIGISKNINLLENYIKKNNRKSFSKNNQNFLSKQTKKVTKSEKFHIAEKNNENEYENNSDDDKDKMSKKKYERKNKTILEFIKVENLFDISKEEGENEKIIDDELHSDDESVFENKVKPAKKISTNYLKTIKKTIPSFNFKQIEFNRDKVNDIDTYSVQRRKYKTKNVDDKIKEMKKKIERINDKISLLKQKESIMRDFVKKLEENYEDLKPMIYQKSDANIQLQNHFIINSLNKGNYKEIEKDEINDFLDGIEEVEERSYNGTEISDEENEIIGNDRNIIGEEIRKEMKEKKMEEKLLKNLYKRKAIQFRKTVNYKHNKNKILVSLPASILKKDLQKKTQRPRSK